MRLTPIKIEAGGVSTINTVTSCIECGQFTTSDGSPLVDMLLWLESPRKTTTHTCRVAIHVDCLRRYITWAEDLAANKLRIGGKETIL